MRCSNVPHLKTITNPRQQLELLNVEPLHVEPSMWNNAELHEMRTPGLLEQFIMAPKAQTYIVLTETRDVNKLRHFNLP